MAATNRENTIESENEAPRLDDSKLATGEGRSTVTSTCIQNGAGGLKPQGGSPADVDAEERTAENRRSLRENMRIGTWNVRTMNQGKLDIMKREMERTGVELMGISEMRWTGMGHFMSDDYEVYYCGQETLRRNGVAFICTDEIRRCVMGFNPVSDRIATIRLQCKPVNMTVLQVYAPTSTAEEGDMEEFYEKVQHVVDEIPRGDVLYVIGDWNAKVGQDKTNGTTGRFGLGERNERGDQLVEFCSRNDFQIMNTFFKLHARRLYTWRSPDQTTRNQIDYIICKTRWRSSVRRVTTLPGADCGTDHNLLIADVKIKLKRIKRAKQTLRYDVENIGLEFAVEVKNRFNGLQLADREPEELWNDIRDIVKETADKRVPKAKRKKVTKWLSDEAVKIADERREVQNKGDDKEYRRLNAAFQRRARQDKEQGIKEKCRQIEERNKMGRTRDLYSEIKEMTGSYSSRCGAMKLSTGKVVTEGKEVKEIWQQYTEELYRRDPNAMDSFNENIYEDEPEVMEIEVKEALRHISNRKSAGCNGIPIELLKAGGEEAVKVMTCLCNCIWKEEGMADRLEEVGVRANL